MASREISGLLPTTAAAASACRPDHLPSGLRSLRHFAEQYAQRLGNSLAVSDGVANVQPGDRVVIEPGISCGRCRRCRSGRYNLCSDVVFLSAPPIDGTLCDYLAIRADMLHKMPPRMSFELGALTEPTAVAVHAVNRGAVRNGETAVILGCGPIGLLTLQAFKAAGGARVVCVDGIAMRREKAAQLGADEIVEPGTVAELLRDTANMVFETAGASSATAAAFAIARPGGRVVQVGWPETNRVALDVAAFIEKELDYIAVNRYANAFPTAITWLADGRIRGDALITHRFPLDAAAEAFQFALDHRAEAIKTLILN